MKCWLTANIFMTNFPKMGKHIVSTFLLQFLALLFASEYFVHLTLTTLSQGHSLDPALMRNTTTFSIPVVYILHSDRTFYPHSPAMSPSSGPPVCASTFFLLCSHVLFVFITYAEIQWFTSTSLLPPSNLVPLSPSETSLRILEHSESALLPPSRTNL